MLVRDLLVRGDLAKSRSEARKAIENKAIRINGQRIEDVNAELCGIRLNEQDELLCYLLVEQRTVCGCDITVFEIDNTVLSFGKKKHVRVFLMNQEDKS